MRKLRSIVVGLSLLLLGTGVAALGFSDADATVAHGYDDIQTVRCHYHLKSGETHCTTEQNCAPDCVTGDCC